MPQFESRLVLPGRMGNDSALAGDNRWDMIILVMASLRSRISIPSNLASALFWVCQSCFYTHLILCAIFLLLALVTLQYPAQAQTAPPPVSFSRYNSPIQGSAQAQAGDYFHLQNKIFRWSDQTKFVLVHISTANYLNDWQPWNPQIIKDAFMEWQRALNNRVIFVFMNDASQADMTVQWWNTASPAFETGACGMNLSQTWGKYLSKNDVFIALHEPFGHPYNPGTLYATALHEIGHSLGIKTHSDNPNDIMYYSTTAQTHLTQRDINTMLKVYAAKADYSNPPGYHLSRFEDFKKTQKGKGFWLPIIIPIPI